MRVVTPVRASLARPPLVLAVLLVLAPLACAADPAEEARVREAVHFLETLASFREAGNKPKLADALSRAVKIHNELRTASMRAKVRGAVGDVLGDEALGAVRMKAATALSRMNDPDGAYKVLKPHLPDVKLAAAGPLPLSVVQAVGALAPDAAIKPLVKLMERAKDPNVSRYAIQALGRFGWSKRRVKVLEAMAAYMVKVRPGVRKGGRNNPDAGRLFAFLRETMVAALNDLTGQRVESIEKWQVLYKENKRSLERLFKIER